MSRYIGTTLVAAALAVAFAGSAGAKELKQIGTIKMPGATLESFDIGWVDQATNRYFLADRSNKSVDIIDHGRQLTFEEVIVVSGPCAAQAFGRATQIRDDRLQCPGSVGRKSPLARVRVRRGIHPNSLRRNRLARLSASRRGQRIAIGRISS